MCGKRDNSLIGKGDKSDYTLPCLLESFGTVYKYPGPSHPIEYTSTSEGSIAIAFDSGSSHSESITYLVVCDHFLDSPSITTRAIGRWVHIYYLDYLLYHHIEVRIAVAITSMTSWYHHISRVEFFSDSQNS